MRKLGLLVLILLAAAMDSGTYVVSQLITAGRTPDHSSQRERLVPSHVERIDVRARRVYWGS